MTRVYLVRHGHAAAGWDRDADPGLDDVGRAQAASVVDRLEVLAAPNPLTVVTSPLRRCRHTAAVLCERWAISPHIDGSVAEIPSPLGVPMSERVAWLRRAVLGTWTELGEPYTTFRDGVVARISGFAADTVVFSHFVAINAVIGACVVDDRIVIRHLDNCSITIVDVEAAGQLTLVEGGHEADTLIR